MDRGCLTVTRVISLEDGKLTAKLHGSRLQNPDFRPIREAPTQTEATKPYKERRQQAEYADLDTPASADANLGSHEEWEVKHPDSCSWQRDEGQFLGFKEVGQPIGDSVPVGLVDDLTGGVWDPRELPIEREWFKDGPLAPVEFTRQSSDGRIALVIDPQAGPVRLLWALMLPEDLATARKALCDRERIPRSKCSSRLGTWKEEVDPPDSIPELPTWATAHGLDAVIWTALGPRFNGQERRPSGEEVIEYLRTLTGPARDNAERYIRCAPRQIDTEYRRRIEAALVCSYRDCRQAAI